MRHHYSHFLAGYLVVSGAIVAARPRPQLYEMDASLDPVICSASRSHVGSGTIHDNHHLDSAPDKPGVHDSGPMHGSLCINDASNVLAPDSTVTGIDEVQRSADYATVTRTSVLMGPGAEVAVFMGPHEYERGLPAHLAVVGMTYSATDSYTPYAAELLWDEDGSVTGDHWTAGADGPVGPVPTNIKTILNGPMGSAIAFFANEPPSGDPFGARFVAEEGYPLGWFGSSVGAYDAAKADVAGVIERSSTAMVADLVGTWSFQITHIRQDGIYTRHGYATFNAGGGFFGLATGATGDPIWVGEGFEFDGDPDYGRFDINLGGGDAAVMYLSADKSVLLTADLDGRDGDSWMGIGLRRGIELTDAQLVGSYRVGVLYEGQDFVDGGDMSDKDGGRFTRTSLLVLAGDNTFTLYDLANADQGDFSSPTASGEWTNNNGVVTLTDVESGISMLFMFSDNELSGLVLGFQQQVPDVFERPMGMVTRIVLACPIDINEDGVVDTRDFLAFLSAWAAGDPVADWDHDGIIGTLDFLAYLNVWVVGC